MCVQIIYVLEFVNSFSCSGKEKKQETKIFNLSTMKEKFHFIVLCLFNAIKANKH